MKSQFHGDGMFCRIFFPLMVLGAFLGCAKDRTQTPAGDFFEPPAARRLNEGSTTQNAPADGSSTVQQTSFEKELRTGDPTWHVSLSEAVAEAESSNRLILADFTGSDWCSHCITLKKKIFSTPEFKSWANQNVTLLELDYPQGKDLAPEIQKQNALLKSRYDIKSYPTVLLIDVEGNVKAKLDYRSGQSAKSWVKMAQSRLPNGSAGSASRIATEASGSQLR